MGRQEPQLEDNVVIGNVYNKYQSKNPIVRVLMSRFHRTLLRLASRTGAREVHEVGCGEGYLARLLAEHGFVVRASDFSVRIINQARRLTDVTDLKVDYQIRSIYDLTPDDSAELVVCCEVLEHLEDPAAALTELALAAHPHLILSVPCEPIWRVLNVARGKYISAGGNTPGHVNHWSRRSFVRLVEQYAEIQQVCSVTPWTFVLARAQDS